MNKKRVTDSQKKQTKKKMAEFKLKILKMKMK